MYLRYLSVTLLIAPAIFCGNNENQDPKQNLIRESHGFYPDEPLHRYRRGHGYGRSSPNYGQGAERLAGADSNAYGQAHGDPINGPQTGTFYSRGSEASSKANSYNYESGFVPHAGNAGSYGNTGAHGGGGYGGQAGGYGQGQGGNGGGYGGSQGGAVSGQGGGYGGFGGGQGGYAGGEAKAYGAGQTGYGGVQGGSGGGQRANGGAQGGYSGGQGGYVGAQGGCCGGRGGQGGSGGGYGEGHGNFGGRHGGHGSGANSAALAKAHVIPRGLFGNVPFSPYPYGRGYVVVPSQDAVYLNAHPIISDGVHPAVPLPGFSVQNNPNLDARNHFPSEGTLPPLNPEVIPGRFIPSAVPPTKAATNFEVVHPETRPNADTESSNIAGADVARENPTAGVNSINDILANGEIAKGGISANTIDV